jgi:hypothetical protein
MSGGAPSFFACLFKSWHKKATTTVIVPSPLHLYLSATRQTV